MWWTFNPGAVSSSVSLSVVAGGLVLRLFAIADKSWRIWMLLLMGTAVIFLVWRFIKLLIIFVSSTAVAAIQLRIVVFLAAPCFSWPCYFVLVAVAKGGVIWASLSIAVDPAPVVGAGNGHSFGAIGLITWHLRVWANFIIIITYNLKYFNWYRIMKCV